MRRGSGEEAPPRDSDFHYRSDEELGLNGISSDEEFSPQDIFDDWMVSLRRDQRQMLAVILMEHFRNRMKLNAKDAATEAGSVVGFNEKLCVVTRMTSSTMKGSSLSKCRASMSVTAYTTMNP